MMNNSIPIIQRFSSYIFLEDRESGQGIVPIRISDPIFKAIIELLIAKQSEIDTPDAWGRIFLHAIVSSEKVFTILYKASISKKYIFEHFTYVLISDKFLFFYLQPVCWYVAQEVSRKLNRSSNSIAGYSLKDYFILACEISLRPVNVLGRFKFESTTSLQSYTKIVLQRITINKIVKEVRDKSLKFTGYGLLKNTSPRALEKALVNHGISSEEIDKYKLVYQAFKDHLDSQLRTERINVYSTKININFEARKEIANRFNSQIRRLGLQLPSIDEVEVIRLLEVLIQSVQSVDKKRMVSLDELTQDFIIGDLPAELVLDSVDNFYEEDSSKQARANVLRAMESLDPLERAILILWSGLEINQADFIGILNLGKQYQVARQFQRYQRTILRRIIEIQCETDPQQSVEQLDIQELCKDKLIYIKEYLRESSKLQLSEWLEDVSLTQLSQQEREDLQKWTANLSQDSSSFHKTSLDVSLSAEATKLDNLFKVKIEDKVKLDLGMFESAQVRIKSFILIWLVVNQAILIREGSLNEA